MKKFCLSRRQLDSTEWSISISFQTLSLTLSVEFSMSVVEGEMGHVWRAFEHSTKHEKCDFCRIQLIFSDCAVFSRSILASRSLFNNLQEFSSFLPSFPLFAAHTVLYLVKLSTGDFNRVSFNSSESLSLIQPRDLKVLPCEFSQLQQFTHSICFAKSRSLWLWHFHLAE